jgi:thioesterase domain-containing protein
VEHSATISMTEMLTPIWQRLLNRPSIGADDDFFDLGGDRVLAFKLFFEIARECGRDLPPETIILAPTLSSLAELLEQPSAARLPDVIQLKPGTEGPPVFINVGVGGTLLNMVPLTRHIATPHPIFGLVAKGTDGFEKPFDRVEDMAPYYVDMIKKYQPVGPYFLIGVSFGGLVMLEMARQLSENGEKIAFFCMLDTFPHSQYLSLGQRADTVFRKARHHFSALMELPFREAVSYFIRRVKTHLPAFGDRRLRILHRQAGDEKSSPRVMRRRAADDLALQRYQPRFYNGKVRYVKAKNGWYFPSDVFGVWNKLVADFEVESVAGDHLGMTVTHYETLASVLSRYLQEASS